MRKSFHSRAVEAGMEITIESDFSRKRHTRILPISHKDFCNGMWAWNRDGKYIQDAFPTLSADDREFLMTGITPEEWDELFGDES